MQAFLKCLFSVGFDRFYSINMNFITFSWIWRLKLLFFFLRNKQKEGYICLEPKPVVRIP